jgi:RHS repeat-associated protein
LNYGSDRVTGYRDPYTLVIPLSGNTIPPPLKRIELQILVAGKRFASSFTAAPNQSTTFVWDGTDVYGRVLQGAQPVTIRIGYVYDAVYQAPAQVAQSFGKYPGVSVTGNSARLESTVVLEQHTTIGSFNAKALGLGAWTLSVQHTYDPTDGVLYLGNGNRRATVGAVTSEVTTVAGGDFTSGKRDGVPATNVAISPPYGITVAPDGSFYIAEPDACVIQRVGSDGIISTVAGAVSCGFAGDNGPATQARLYLPRGVAVGPDGTLYIADTGNSRVRQVTRDGIITTIAGTGTLGSSGDGGPATQAQLFEPEGVAVAPDGSVYIADATVDCVRRIDPNGIIATVAGQCGLGGDSGDGGPASQALLDQPRGIALGTDGSLYIGGVINVRRVDPSGKITTVAGGHALGFGGDGGPATEALLGGPFGVAVSPDGSLYIADSDNARVRRVGPDGIITTVAGTDHNGFEGDSGPATNTALNLPFGIALGPEGSVYIADTNNYRVRRIDRSLPLFTAGDLFVTSADGSELYSFDPSGRHLQTLNTFTGAVLYRFTYDSANRLASLTDRSGNVTTIERDANGDPAAIIAPNSQQMTLSVDANGYLNTGTDAAGAVVHLSYTADGLLTQFTDPRNNSSHITYDTQGRLVQDKDAAGGFQNLSHTEAAKTHTVTRTTALGRTTTYQLAELPTGDEQRTVTFPDSTQNQVLNQSNGKETLALRNGTTLVTQQGPDPRFGMQAPLSTSRTFTTPGGRTWSATADRTVNLTDPANPLTLVTQTDTVKINGRTYTRTYDAANRLFTLTTPAKRQYAATLDARGHLIQATVGGLTPVQLTYDSQGRVTTLTQGDRTYTFTYNGQGFLSQFTDPLLQSLSFTRDAIGRTTTLTRADNEQIQFTYDPNGNMTSLSPPGRSPHTFNFTSVNLLQNYEPPTLGGSPTDVQLFYNPDRQLTQLLRGGTSINLNYDAGGRLQSFTSPQEMVNASYDSAGRLQRLTTADGIDLTYSYDGSLLTDTSWSGSVMGTVHRTFDDNLRLTSRTINGGNTQTFAYDADGLLTQAEALTLQRDAQNGLLIGTTLGTVSDTRSSNGFGEWTSYSASAGTTPLLATQYTRDQRGRLMRKSETVGGVTTTFDYDYDLVGRLITVKQNSVTVSTYTYDANDNRLSRTTAGGTITGTYDAQDRLTGYGATTYTYTANGDLLSKTTSGQTASYGYDVLGNLRSVSLPGGTQVEYLIDGRDRRVGKKLNGAKVQGFLYQDRLKPVAELDGSDALVSTFIYGSRPNVPDYLVKGGSTYRIIADEVGSPRLVVNTSTGAIVQQLDYDEFGNVLLDTNPGFQPFGFAGGLYDQHTKLVRLGARDYDAETGRWTSKDAIGLAAGLNLYAYVANDPINFIDFTGRNAVPAAPSTAAGASGVAAAGTRIVGALLGGTSAAIAGGAIVVTAGGIVVATAILAAATLESSALEHADTMDDEGPGEGGAPDVPDGGVCEIGPSSENKRRDPRVDQDDPTMPGKPPEGVEEEPRPGIDDEPTIRTIPKPARPYRDTYQDDPPTIPNGRGQP